MTEPFDVKMVGGLFDPDRDRWPEGAHLWMDDQVRLAVFLARPHPVEVSAVEGGTPRFGWTEHGQTGYLLFKYGELPWNAAPFDPGRLTEPFDLAPMAPGEHKPVYSFLVNADTGIIRAMRMFTWPGYFVNHVIASVHRLEALPHAEPEARAEMREFYRRHPDGRAMHRLARTLPMEARCQGGQRDDRPFF